MENYQSTDHLAFLAAPFAYVDGTLALPKGEIISMIRLKILSNPQSGFWNCENKGEMRAYFTASARNVIKSHALMKKRFSDLEKTPEIAVNPTLSSSASAVELVKGIRAKVGLSDKMCFALYVWGVARCKESEWESEKRDLPPEVLAWLPEIDGEKQFPLFGVLRLDFSNAKSKIKGSPYAAQIKRYLADLSSN